MPTEKRARQKAARQRKKAAEARRLRTRKRLRSGGFVVGGAAIVIVLVLLSTGAFSGSPAKSPSKKQTTPQATANRLAVAAHCPSSPSARVNTDKYSSAPPMTIDTAKTYSATVKTTAGTFDVSLDASAAPTTVNNFVFLAGKGYYKCNIFHRVVTGFVDQSGDPTGTGTGGPGYSFANENIPTSYASGDLAMANSGGTHTNGSQFFVVVPGGTKTLNADLASGNKYSLFGKVTSGMSVVEKINAEGSATGKPKVTQRILSVTIHTS